MLLAKLAPATKICRRLPTLDVDDGYEVLRIVVSALIVVSQESDASLAFGDPDLQDLPYAQGSIPSG
jgi:hypothetical protein